jgi:hypothetical protein
MKLTVPRKTNSRAYLRTIQQLNETQNSIEHLRMEQQLQTRSALVQTDHTTAKATSTSRQYLSTFTPSEFWKWLLACELVIVMTTDGAQKRYDCFAIFLLPTLIGRLALKISLSFQRPSSTWSNLLILGGRLGVVNYVPKESEVIIACRKGDLVAVQKLFRQGVASPNDVSERSKSLLWVCIPTHIRDSANKYSMLPKVDQLNLGNI